MTLYEGVVLKSPENDGGHVVVDVGRAVSRKLAAFRIDPAVQPAVVAVAAESPPTEFR
jgi:hypothetical protein